RSQRRQLYRPGLRHCGLRVHDLRRAAGRAKACAHVAAGPRAGLDARAPVARTLESADDSVPRRISFWRDADAGLDVAHDYCGRQRRLRSGVAKLRAAGDDQRCSARNDYDEIGNVRKALRMEADKLVESVCGRLGLVKEIDEGQRAGGFTALRPIAASSAPLRTSAAVS